MSERISVSGLRAAIELKDVYVVGADSDVLTELLDVVEAARAYRQGSYHKVRERTASMDDALARFDFGAGGA